MGGTNGTKLTDGNYILSAHIYPGSWNQAKGCYVNTSDIDDMASSGRPCMIGEFGNSGGSGADWSAIADYVRNKGWTVLAWSWNGDGGSMNMVHRPGQPMAVPLPLALALISVLRALNYKYMLLF